MPDTQVAPVGAQQKLPTCQSDALTAARAAEAHNCGGTWSRPLPADRHPPHCPLLLITPFLPCSLTVPSLQPPRWGRRNQPINMNHYANKKSAAESMLDIALLMANASQLKAVVEQGPSFAFFVPLVVLISISLALQISVGVLLIFLVKYDLNNPAKHAKLDFLNNLATGLVFIIVVVNIFITAFGVQKPVMDVAPRQ
ncbi:ninjurin 1 [Ictidomys tridecemlineatus]|nr:ninjurin 1 [Ictidomys tridecemlineatus]